MTTTRLRTASVLIVGVAVIALAGLWLIQRDTPEAHAQQVIDACENSAAETYFDVGISGVSKSLDGEDSMSGEIKISVAGTDFHYAEDFHYPEDTNLVGGLEVILKDGVGYNRFEGVPWKLDRIWIAASPPVAAWWRSPRRAGHSVQTSRTSWRR